MAASSDCWPSWARSMRDQSELAWQPHCCPVHDLCRFSGDPQWSETGDRYLMKLFRDYLFHQVHPSGKPWVDLAHIVQTLNKVCVCVGGGGGGEGHLSTECVYSPKHGAVCEGLLSSSAPFNILILY